MANTFRVDKYKSSEAFAYVAIALLGLTVALNFLYIVLGVVNLVNPQWHSSIEEGSFLFLFVAIIEVISASEFILFLIGAIFFLIWLHRAFSNLSPLKARDLEFSPGWSVGWWFVPFANLFKPYQAVTELWRESDPDFDEELGFLSSSMENPTFLGAWWAGWIISNFTARITMKLGESQDPETLQIFFGSLIISSLITMIAGMLLIYIIWDTTKRQEKRFERIQASSMQLPPEPPVFNE